jgi:hypothetical protein
VTRALPLDDVPLDQRPHLRLVEPDPRAAAEARGRAVLAAREVLSAPRVVVGSEQTLPVRALDSIARFLGGPARSLQELERIDALVAIVAAETLRAREGR